MGNCANLNNMNILSDRGMGFFPDKVFPEEVDNIKEYMRDTFTTNINAYSLSDPSKLKGDSSNDLITPNNFLQEDEISSSMPRYYDQRQSNNAYNRNPRGIDSASLNRRYLNMNNNRRRNQKNYIDENQNFNDINNLSERDFYDENEPNANNNNNYVNNTNRNSVNNNGNNRSPIIKVTNENKNAKNNEINLLAQKNMNKIDFHKEQSNENNNNNKSIEMNKKPSNNEEQVNNHKMLRRMG